MGFLTDVFPSRNKSPPQDVPKIHLQEATSTPPSGPVATDSAPPPKPLGDSPPASHPPPISQADEPEAPLIGEQSDKTKNPDTSPSVNRRWSIQSPLGLIRKAKSSPSDSDAHDARAPTASKAAEVIAKRAPLSITDRRAQESALVVRSLMVGQNPNGSPAPPQVRVSRAQLNSVKAQLLKPKAANQIIAQLRTLPALADSSDAKSPPIRAVCLPDTDDKVSDKYFSQMRKIGPKKEPEDHSIHFPTIASSTVESIAKTFEGLHISSLFTAPALGLGEPGDGPGLLAGAVPTAETVINGIVKITPELMALGYATGKNIVPDHVGVYPPIDRMSVLTYWWGFELVLPPPSLAYLGRAQSITYTLMNFLTAMSVINEGVREIIPFVRYISQYVDFEWSSIKAQDHGKGVVCAATWIMPAAIIARPWDFPERPKGVVPPAAAPSDTTAPVPASTQTAPGDKATPTPTSPPPAAASGSPPSPAPAAHDIVPGVVNPASGS